MQWRTTVVDPRNGADGLRKSCGTVRGDYVHATSWLGALPERDLTSNFADDVGRHSTGNGWGGCADVAHLVGTCEVGRCRIWVDPWSPGFHEAGDELLRALLGNSTCRTDWRYFSPHVLRHVWIQGRHFDAWA